MLERAGIARPPDIVLALTGDDEDNLVIAQLAREKYGVEQVIARVNDPRNQAHFDLLGISPTVCATSSIMALVEHEVPEHDLIHLLELRRENLEIVEVQIDRDSPSAGKRVEKRSSCRTAHVSSPSCARAAPRSPSAPRSSRRVTRCSPFSNQARRTSSDACSCGVNCSCIASDRGDRSDDCRPRLAHVRLDRVAHGCLSVRDRDHRRQRQVADAAQGDARRHRRLVADLLHGLFVVTTTYGRRRRSMPRPVRSVAVHAAGLRVVGGERADHDGDARRRPVGEVDLRRLARRTHLQAATVERPRGLERVDHAAALAGEDRVARSTTRTGT